MAQTNLPGLTVPGGTDGGPLAITPVASVPTGTFILPTAYSIYHLSPAGPLTSSTSTPLTAGTINGQVVIYTNLLNNTLTIKAGGNLRTPAGNDISLTQYDTFAAMWISSTSEWYTLFVSTNA